MLSRLTISSSLAFEFHLLTEMILARDISNNTFDGSDVPPWFQTLRSLTTLYSTPPLSLSLSLSQCVCLCLNMHLYETNVFIFPG